VTEEKMPGKLTDDERAFKKLWSAAFTAQKADSRGYDDFGEFSAHIALGYRQEVQRLRALLEQNGIDPESWYDPLPDE
jgi:hypothetical protein